VQDAEEADPDAQVLWIGCDRLKSFGRSPKQQTIHLSFVLKSQSREWCRQSENHMEVIALQQFGLTLLQPFRTDQRLAFGTMPVRAGVVTSRILPKTSGLLA
jgi:hypothetical protein